jgi:hypothetical protein
MTAKREIPMRLAVLLITAVAVLTSPALATNTPCSKKKGGIVGCLGSKFLCRDGSTSASKKTCTKDQADLDGGSDDDGEVAQFKTDDDELAPAR